MARTTNLRYLGRERTLAEAQRLFLAARNAEALAALGRNPDPAADALRARCFLRLRDAQHAIEALEGRVVANLPDAEKAEHHMLVSAAYLRAGEREKAHRHDAAAAVVAYAIGGAAAVELAFYRSVAAWSARDLETAELLALDGLDVRPVADDTDPRPQRFLRALLLETLSLICASREDYAMQAELINAAWRAEEGDAPHQGIVHDEWIRASLLRNLSPLVWDLRLEDETAFLEMQSDLFAWSPETADARWAAKRALGWHAALTGNQVLAFQRFRDAIALAPTPAYRLGSTLDRAFLAQQLGQTIILREEMNAAYGLASHIKWESVTGHEVTPLLSLVEAYAREDTDVARAWLRTYDRARAMPANLLLLGSHDRRQTAMERDAEGAVLAAEGHVDAAAVAWHSAMTIWDALDHRWRAARTALAVAELTHAEHDAACARDRVAAFHKSWLGKRMRRFGKTDVAETASTPGPAVAKRARPQKPRSRQHR